MQIVHEASLPWSEQRSPKGSYHLFRRHLSEALGAPRDAGVAGGGHPFDVEQAKLPPGAVNFPFHSHAAQWELYIILSGTGVLRVGEKTVNVKGGDTFVCPPGEPHQLKNTGSKDLLYFIIADNPPADIIHYPDSNKWLTKPGRQCFKMEKSEYFDPED